MKKIFCIIILHLLSSQVLGQTNLVPNWSFETYTLCPNASGQLSSAVPWTGQTNNSSDYYNACSSTLNVPNLGGGSYQLAKDGNAFAGIWTAAPTTASGANYREYLQVMLNDSLVNSRCYYVEFFANLFDFAKWGTNNIAANISKIQYGNTGTGYILNLPQHITRYGNPAIMDTANWVQVAGIYSATGGEQFITIGNFKDDLNTDTVRTNNPYDACYYYIDAVSVYSINPSGPLPWAYRDTTINYGDSIYIGNYLGGSFSSNWYLQGGGFIKNASGIFVKPTITSNYIVEFTICGVPHMDTLKVTVQGGAGINEPLIQSSEFNISPNPNNGIITLEILNKDIPLQKTMIKICDIFNREVKSLKLLGKKQELELQDLSNGIYYLQFLQDNKVLLTKKIIKQ